VDLEPVSFLKVRNWDFKLSKSFYRKYSQFGGVRRQPPVINSCLADKAHYLLPHVGILDIEGWA